MVGAGATYQNIIVIGTSIPYPFTALYHLRHCFKELRFLPLDAIDIPFFKRLVKKHFFRVIIYNNL